MTEGQVQAIITGLFALLGVALGALGGYFQARHAASLDREKDERRRKWSLRDFARDRRLSVRDARCRQAEEFMTAMSKDFHEFRTHAIRLLALDPTSPIPPALHEFAWWQKRIDKAVFEYGPVISAISTRKLDLKAPWTRIEQAWNDMSAHYTYAYGEVIVKQRLVPNPEELSSAITEVYEAYNDAQREFIVTIDKIKASRLR